MAKSQETQTSPAHKLFWMLAEELQEGDEHVAESTMMGLACLRVGGQFVAMPHHKVEGLVVKLPASRVADLIEDGTGEKFAPAGKVFKEWLAVTSLDESIWRNLLAEGVQFAR